MKIGLVLSFALALVPTALARNARAQEAPTAPAASTDDEVTLVDGTVVRGRITQQQTGSFVVVMANDGRVHTLAWSRVAGVTTAPRLQPAAAIRVQPSSGDAPPPPEMPAQVADSAAPPIAFELGARLGYSFASGDYATGESLDNPSSSSLLPMTKGGAPIAADAGLRVGHHWYLGAVAQYAFVSTGCPTAAAGLKLDCSAHDIRVGTLVAYHFAPKRRVDPWLGWGVTYEWLATSMSVASSKGTGTASQMLSGWNPLDVLVGVDVGVSPSFRLGPFAEISYGRFASASADVTSGSTSSSASGDISSTSGHQWLTIGVRGAFSIGAE